MGEKNIIKSETKGAAGIYIIDVDKDKASKIEGNNNRERLNNAINEFLNQKDLSQTCDSKHQQRDR